MYEKINVLIHFSYELEEVDKERHFIVEVSVAEFCLVEFAVEDVAVLSDITVSEVGIRNAE